MTSELPSRRVGPLSMEPEDFTPVVVSQPLTGPARTTAESRRWTFSRASVVRVQQSGAVSDLRFSPLAPFDVAAACGPTVTVVDPQAGAVRRTFARFRDVARSPDYKPDGRLLSAGCDNGTVQLFDLSSRAVLRAFKGHNGAVHSTRFTPDGLRILSGSDDCIVRAWDLGTSKLLFSIKGATDYVRAQSSSPASKHLWAAGSYDRRARVYDLRTRSLLYTLDHGHQVDDVILLPGGSRAITIGGPEVRIWDFFSGGDLVATLRPHAKAVTSGALNGDGDKLFTGGLDGLVKVHSLSSLQLVSTMSYRGQVLSVAVSPQDNRVAAGLIDGSVDVRLSKKGVRAEDLESDEDPLSARTTLPGGVKERMFEGWGRGFEKPKQEGPSVGSMRYYLRGANDKAVHDGDAIMTKKKKYQLKPHDFLLKKFSYREALDSVLVREWKPRDVEVASSLIEELVVRNCLGIALSERNDDSLALILGLVLSSVDVPKHATLMTHLLNCTLDTYASSFGRSDKSTIDQLLLKIQGKIQSEVSFQRDLLRLQGMIEVLPTRNVESG